jgi:hypothetical protein
MLCKKTHDKAVGRIIVKTERTLTSDDYLDAGNPAFLISAFCFLPNTPGPLLYIPTKSAFRPMAAI